jgi:hypothetical protein
MIGVSSYFTINIIMSSWYWQKDTSATINEWHVLASFYHYHHDGTTHHAGITFSMTINIAMEVIGSRHDYMENLNPVREIN